MKAFIPLLVSVFACSSFIWSQTNTFPSTGNVGIGTENPEYKLHVTGGAKIKKTTIGATSSSGGNSWLRDDWLTGNYGPVKWSETTSKWVRPAGTYNDVGGIIWQDEGTYFIRRPPGENLEFSNNEFLDGAFLFAQMFTGNVGIGTTNPGSWKLAVNGKIRAKEIKVETNWSDFVFGKDYELPSLKEVESHIKDKGHLKDIPSAMDVEEHGIYLGEMDSKLLQKIEELTLYTIQQQKEIETLKNENKELEMISMKLLTLQSRIEKLESVK